MSFMQTGPHHSAQLHFAGTRTKPKGREPPASICGRAYKAALGTRTGSRQAVQKEPTSAIVIDLESLDFANSETGPNPAKASSGDPIQP
jgi:hypothetical protein